METSRTQSRINSSSITNLRRSQNLCLRNHAAASALKKSSPIPSPTTKVETVSHQISVPLVASTFPPAKSRLTTVTTDGLQSVHRAKTSYQSSPSESKDRDEFPIVNRTAQAPMPASEISRSGRDWHTANNSDSILDVAGRKRNRHLINYAEDEED